MTTIDCIDSTGDKEVNITHKNEPSFSRAVAKELVAEILENALECVTESSEKRPMGDIFGEQFTSKSTDNKNKTYKSEESVCPFKGIGDHSTNQEILTPEKSQRHPPVEKKNRLTDLVKNSKQILARYIQSKTDMSVAQEMNSKEEKVVNIIELDCVNPEDSLFKSRIKVLPENVPLPRDDSREIILNNDDEKMDEIRLGMTNSEPGPSKDEVCIKTMTFPMATGSSKTSFAAKCRTLRMNAGDFRKKKWNLGSKIANFLKKRSSKGHVDKNDERDKDESFEDGDQMPDNEKELVTTEK